MRTNNDAMLTMILQRAFHALQAFIPSVLQMWVEQGMAKHCRASDYEVWSDMYCKFLKARIGLMRSSHVRAAANRLVSHRQHAVFCTRTLVKACIDRHVVHGMRRPYA